MDNKRRFKATIAGKDYTIVGNRSATHLNTVVDLINQQLEQLAELAPDLSVGDRSVLMSINAMSDQLVKEKQIMELEAKIVELEQELQTPTQQLRKQFKPKPGTLPLENVDPESNLLQPDSSRVLPRSAAEGLIAGASPESNQTQPTNQAAETASQTPKFPYKLN